jgi:hypothetical protein
VGECSTTRVTADYLGLDALSAVRIQGLMFLRKMTAPTSVAEMVRKKLDAGTLPLDAPVKLWARFGHGNPCSACEQPIHPSEPGYEPEYQADQSSVPCWLLR